MQVVVDVFCSLAFAKVYTAKMPVTAADLLYDRVLPFYEALGVKVGAILTDNGREFCGIQGRHPYELLLAMEDIEHRTTKIRSPRTNGFVELQDFAQWTRPISSARFPLIGPTLHGLPAEPQATGFTRPSCAKQVSWP